MFIFHFYKICPLGYHYGKLTSELRHELIRRGKGRADSVATRRDSPGLGDSQAQIGQVGGVQSHQKLKLQRRNVAPGLWKRPDQRQGG